MRIGILDLQGDVREHANAFLKCGVDVARVKKAWQLSDVDALVIPGGESTTIGTLMERYGLSELIRRRALEGMPVFGTCAGLILMASSVLEEDVPGRLGIINVAVRRNAYGRQIESFEADIHIPAIGDDPFRAVFIRAPVIESISPGVEVLAEFEGYPVLVREGKFLASSFHPELTDDLRICRYFLDMIQGG
jgi:5'-phosphate synthase pdxT subunit